MNKELHVSNNERAFILEALKQDLRVDGRTPLTLRNIKLEFGHKDGTVQAQMGKTRCVASVTAEIVAPKQARPSEGLVNICVDFSPMASHCFVSGRPSDTAIELSRAVERGIRDSRAVDTETLCIIAGEKVWSIRVDVHVVDHEGNLADCANLAAVVALRHFRRPDVSVMGTTITLHNIKDKQPVPVAIHHTPISTTFAIFFEGTRLVVDPCLKEELICEGTLTLILNSDKEVCCVQKGGGTALPIKQIMKCTNIALKKTLEVHRLINKRLKEECDSVSKRGVRDLNKGGFARPIDVVGSNVTREQTEQYDKQEEIEAQRREEKERALQQGKGKENEKLKQAEIERQRKSMNILAEMERNQELQKQADIERKNRERIGQQNLAKLERARMAEFEKHSDIERKKRAESEQRQRESQDALALIKKKQKKKSRNKTKKTS